MPYRINPQNRREVQVKRNGKWIHKGTSASPSAAKKYLAKLQMIEREKEK